uniref:Uncharacterized protein n=1 Tax=Ciona savignyi TaxID=51511 RepID=H2ZJD9_CIOSA
LIIYNYCHISIKHNVASHGFSYLQVYLYICSHSSISVMTGIYIYIYIYIYIQCSLV